MRKLLTYIFVIFTCIFDTYGQSNLPAKLKFHSIDVEEGLPNNTVNSIVQDSLGFIWIGTNDGLCRYDGNSFKYFKESLKESNTISNNFIESIFLDNVGNLWIMTDQGLNKYDPTFEQFTTFTAQQGLSYNSVTKMIQGSDGIYYIGTYGGGVDVFDGQKFLKNYSPDAKMPLASYLISDLQLQDDKILWVATFDNGISKIDIASGNVENLGFGEGSITSSGRINSIYLDQSGFLWIMTDRGISIYNTLEDSYFLISEENCTSLVDDDILTMFENLDGELWFGTRNAGILTVPRRKLLLKKEQVHFKQYLPDGTDENISHRSVGSIYQDFQNNIWIGTHQGGVNIVQPEGEKIRYYPSLREDSEFDKESFWGICEADDGKIWAGTDGEGLILFDPMTNEWEHFDHDENDLSSLSDNAILTVLVDSDNNLWLGTYAGGINKMEKGVSGFKHYKKDYLQKSVNSNDVRVLFEDSSARIWVGSNGGGLQLYNATIDGFEFMQEVGWIDIRAIAEDAHGVLWLGTYGNGLLSFDPSTRVLTEHPEIELFNSHIIFSLFAAKDHIIWIGTRYKGLLKYDTNNKKVTQYTESDGLSNNTVNAIIPDNNGQIWISTNDGLNSFDPDKEKFTQFRSSNGIQPGRFNNGSGFLSSEGYLVFGGINGLNVFYPEQAKNKPLPSKVVLTDFKLFNQSVSVSNDSLNGPLTKNISELKNIELKHDENSITFNYIGLHYPFLKDQNYAYRLLNYDNDWNLVGDLSTATYRNLSPGTYIFQAAIVDYSGEIGMMTEDLSIVIKPPIWLTWPAIVTYVIILILLIYVGARYYAKQIKLRNSLFYEKKLRQKEYDLNQERFRFFTSFSHELRTPLTLILGPAKDMILKEKNELKLEKLKMIKRNSNVLLELINKMLEFRKTETEHNHLELGNYPFDHFVTEIHENFKFYASQKAIDFKLNVKNGINIWFDYKKIQLVINNLLSNAFKYTPSEGTITISIMEKPDWVQLTIKDSGPGIKKEALSSIFDLYFHNDLEEVIDGTGIGLALCKKLMDLHGGKIDARSQWKKGAEFKIQLHKNKYHYEKMENVTFLNDNKYIIRKPFLKSSQNSLSNLDEIIEKDDRVVLIIDDNEDVVKYVSDILSEQYKIITAKDGNEGLAWALKFIPDLIISDIMMPNKSGTELCKELKNKSQTSHIPIVFLTAKLESENQLKSMNLGADAYITKPFDSEFLKACVKNLFANRSKLIRHYQENMEQHASQDLFLSNKNTRNDQLEKQFLKKLEDLIMKRLDEKDLPIPILARELGFSRSSLYRKVKAITGLSINQFVRKVRLNQAAKLIEQSEMNVSQIAYEVGFNDLKYFRNCFKEQFGVPPSIYRKRKLVRADS